MILFFKTSSGTDVGINARKVIAVVSGNPGFTTITLEGGIKMIVEGESLDAANKLNGVLRG